MMNCTSHCIFMKFLCRHNNTPMVYCITCKYYNTWMLKGIYFTGHHCALIFTSLWSDFHERVRSLVKSHIPLIHWLQTMLLFPGTCFYRWKLFHKKKKWELVRNGSFLCCLVLTLWWQAWPLSLLHPESDHINILLDVFKLKHHRALKNINLISTAVHKW